MKQKILLIIFVFSGMSLYAQQLYFMRATIGEYDYRKFPPTQIIAYIPDTDTILQVYKDFTNDLPDKTIFDAVEFYPKYNVFIFKPSYTGFSSYVLCTNHPDTIIEMPTQCPKNYKVAPFLSMNIIHDHWAYECWDSNASDKVNASRFKGIDFSLSNHFDIRASDYKDLYLTGVVVQRVELKPNDGHMYLPIVADIENRPPFSVELPEKYWVKTTMYKTIYVNDDEKFLIWIDSKQPSENDNYGRGFAALYNKKKQVWTDVELKGNAPSIMSYGHWLAGYVMDVRNPARYSPKTNPGKATRDSVSMENPFDFQNPGKYFPGILYLYNTDTQKYIEWETEQGDSEILLVQGEVVYYRVFDEIYKAAIINGEYLGQPELLVKDNRVVPYIHWAFLGNKK